MANCTEYLVYQEIIKKVKDKYGPHKHWLRLISFDVLMFEQGQIDRWLQFNHFHDRVVKQGKFNGYSWVEVDKAPWQPSQTWTQQIENGVFFHWAITPQDN